MISIYLYDVFGWPADAATAYFTLGLLIATVGLILVAWRQLKKTRQATNADSLNAYLQLFRSPEMTTNRKKLAMYILDNGLNDSDESNIKVKFTELMSKTVYSPDELDWISKTKNVIEEVIYNFEILGYFTIGKRTYSPNDTYQLFSYEIQQFWVLVNDSLGFIDFLRFNKFNGEEDLYEYFEKVFYKMMILEVLSLENGLWFCNKIRYRFLSINGAKRDSLCTAHIANKIRSTILFLEEEKNI